MSFGDLIFCQLRPDSSVCQRPFCVTIPPKLSSRKNSETGTSFTLTIAQFRPPSLVIRTAGFTFSFSVMNPAAMPPVAGYQPRAYRAFWQSAYGCAMLPSAVLFMHELRKDGRDL